MNFLRLKPKVARTSPEAAENDLRRSEQHLEQTRQNVIVFGLKVKALQHIVAALKKRLPAEAAPFEADLNKLRQVHAECRQKFEKEASNFRQLKATLAKSRLTPPLRAAR
jgi:hypothetical protein